MGAGRAVREGMDVVSMMNAIEIPGIGTDEVVEVKTSMSDYAASAYCRDVKTRGGYVVSVQPIVLSSGGLPRSRVEYVIVAVVPSEKDE